MVGKVVDEQRIAEFKTGGIYAIWGKGDRVRYDRLSEAVKDEFVARADELLQQYLALNMQGNESLAKEALADMHDKILKALDAAEAAQRTNRQALNHTQYPPAARHL